jgi:hypothetical protein
LLNHIRSLGIGGGRSPAKPVSTPKIPCQQGKCREFCRFRADSAENDLANVLIVHRFSQEFPTRRAGNSWAELTFCREIAFASREFLTRLFEGRQGTRVATSNSRSQPLIRATPSALSRMTIGLLDVARAPHRANAAPAAADRLDHHAPAVPSGEEDPGRRGARAARRSARRAPSPWPCRRKGRVARASGQPSQTRRLVSFGELRVCAQKTLAGVDGVASGLPGDGVEPRPRRDRPPVRALATMHSPSRIRRTMSPRRRRRRRSHSRSPYPSPSGRYAARSRPIGDQDFHRHRGLSLFVRPS